MQTRVSAAAWSALRITGVLGGALAVLLGAMVLTGWAVHSTLLIQVAPSLAPMPRNTAISFILSGIALLGIVIGKPPLILVGSAITAAISAGSVLQYLLHANFGIDELLGVAYITTQAPDHGRMSPATALSFLFFAVGAVLAQTSLSSKRPAVLGLTGLLVAAIGATCSISVLSGPATPSLSAISTM